MINYIELNGTKSTDVKGLIIQSLPPISKPKVRTSIEEIDGRDGDIVTRLGYAAYDKEVSIGLHGDFDIDDAIAFFDSEGEVVFGNERDKYYRYQILDQIDFERLVRFRTAKVKLHVQPFKYDAVDRVFEAVGKSVTLRNRGNVASRPTITVYGSGTVELAINAVTVLSMAIGSGYITIDAEEMNAYHGDALVNRNVSGDYSDVKLNVGENVISCSGNVTEIKVEDYSRWV
jgi:predicted phage tail component-like protein